MPIAYLLFGVVLVYLGVRGLIRWVRQAPLRPDPWGETVNQALEQPEAAPVCHKCFTPQAADAWFCPDCGSAVGPYNNLMPYVYIFSVGELLRNGVTEKFRPGALTIGGYVVIALVQFVLLTPLLVIAPFYWFRLWQNVQRIRKDASIPESL